MNGFIKKSQLPGCGGFALLMVMMLIAIASVVGGSYLYATSIRAVISQNVIVAGRSQYLAESGIQHAMRNLRENGPWGSVYIPAGPYYADSTSDSYKFYITETGGDSYKITATGTVGQITQSASATVSIRNEYVSLMQSISPKHWWRMDDTMYWAADQQGLNHGSFKNGVGLRRSGSIATSDSYSTRYDGWDDRVDLGKLFIAGSGFTVGGWGILDDWGNDNSRMFTGLAYGAKTWGIGTTTYKRLMVYLNINGITRFLTSSSYLAQSQEWMFILATYDGSYIKLYYNGEEVAKCAATGNIVSKPDEYVFIGNCPGFESYNAWDGKLDELFTCSYALSSEKIRQLYQARYSRIQVENWE